MTRARLEIEGDVAVLTGGDGAVQRLALPQVDWEGALSRLRELNAQPLADGRPLPSALQWRGFEIWWFGQDALLHNHLIPVQVYGEVLRAALRYRTLEVQGPVPKGLRYALLLLRRAGTRVRLTPSQPPARLRDWWGMARKLVDTVRAARRARGVVWFYVLRAVTPRLGCDRRIAEIYAELRRRQVPFVELVSSVRNHDAGAELRLRGRPALYFHQIDRLAGRVPAQPRPPLRDEPVDAIERALLDHYWTYCCWQLRQTRVLHALVRLLRPAALLMLDDNRNMFPAVAAARECGVPTLSFQHGMSTRYHAAHYAYGRGQRGRDHAPDLHYVWSDYARERLLRDSTLFVPSRVVVGGHIRRLPRVTSRAARTGGPIRVLWAGETHLPLERVRPFIEALLADGAFELVFRPRPEGFDAAHQARICDFDWPIEFSSGRSLEEDLRRSDVVIGTHTTVLYESYLYMVPSVVMSVPGSFAQDMIGEWWALTAHEPAEMAARVREAADMSRDEILRRQRHLWGDDEDLGFVRVVDGVEDLLAARRAAKRDEAVPAGVAEAAVSETFVKQ